jgi:hypothetical protein
MEIPTLAHINGSNAVELTYGIDQKVYSLLHVALQSSPVLELRSAVGAVLTLAVLAQGTKDKTNLKMTAIHACNLVFSIVVVQQKQTAEGKVLSPEHVKNLQTLVVKLEPIQKSVTELVSRKGSKRQFLRILQRNKSQASQMQKYQKNLQDVLSEFSLNSARVTQAGIVPMDERPEGATNASGSFAHSIQVQSQDGNMRVDGRPEDATNTIEPIEPRANQPPDNPPEPEFPTPVLISRPAGAIAPDPTLEPSGKVLSTLKMAAEESPVPILRSAATAALTLAALVLVLKDDNTNFKMILPRSLQDNHDLHRFCYCWPCHPYCWRRSFGPCAWQ